MKLNKLSIVLLFTLNSFLFSNSNRNFPLQDPINKLPYPSLTELRWTEIELKQISNILPGEIFLYEQATEQSFKKRAKDAGIIHLATHTQINNENPMYSKLVFYNDKNKEEDHYLNTYEIYNLDTKAQMVVLSACNSGIGKIVKGEGSLSLARGFMYAGIPSVIMSLWPVDDQSTFKIMTSFYQNIALGKQKDIALRESKLQYLKETDPLLASPYYWAGFIPLGNREPIKKEATHYRLYYLIPLLILLGFGLYFKNKNH